MEKNENNIIRHHIINSLTRRILKITVPEILDAKQNIKGWGSGLAGLDTGEHVNYQQFSVELDAILSQFSIDPDKLVRELWTDVSNGKINWLFTHLSIQERKERATLFEKGSYETLEVRGLYKDHVIAFIRKYLDDYLMILLPVHTAGLPKDCNWAETTINLPEFVPYKWENRFTGQIIKTNEQIKLQECFQPVPFALLRGLPFEPHRRAGVLMHISSLPGDFGIGDFGRDAYSFVDFLSRTKQQYWQILPLNISDRLTGFSPYSSYSAFAGNVLFIDPEHLATLDLVNEKEIKAWKIKSKQEVDYLHAEKAKYSLLEKAFGRLKEQGQSQLKEQFGIFKKKEAYWLDDFAKFVALKKHQKYQSWNEWPVEYRDRDKNALKKFAADNAYFIEKICFGQFLFLQQWTDLKTYANNKGVDIVGDIPIYVSYDSADVWSQPHWFRLKQDKSMEAVAGVPPDYFNANGQLWGMPLYSWNALEEDGYNWWLQRIAKNLEFFDVLRLDHFRGFSAFWEVPADHETALHGKWVEGPGKKLFDVVLKRFPHMPFIAEDLGQIDQAVYDLRDHYNLPGMKVVQFGFGDHMPFLQHVPNNHTYNSLAYTGTHDNNTMKGWFRTEADKETIDRFKRYTGVQLTEENCHLEFIRKTYASVAKTAIIPMQDWLGLDENHRMNFPSTTEGNWLWRMLPNAIDNKLEKRMKQMVKDFGRY